MPAARWPGPAATGRSTRRSRPGRGSPSGRRGSAGADATAPEAPGRACVRGSCGSWPFDSRSRAISSIRFACSFASSRIAWFCAIAASWGFGRRTSGDEEERRHEHGRRPAVATGAVGTGLEVRVGAMTPRRRAAAGRIARLRGRRHPVDLQVHGHRRPGRQSPGRRQRAPGRSRPGHRGAPRHRPRSRSRRCAAGRRRPARAAPRARRPGSRGPAWTGSRSERRARPRRARPPRSPPRRRRARRDGRSAEARAVAGAAGGPRGSTRGPGRAARAREIEGRAAGPRRGRSLGRRVSVGREGSDGIRTASGSVAGRTAGASDGWGRRAGRTRG